MFPYLTDAVRRTLFSAEPPGLIAPNRAGWTVERLEWGDPENQARSRRLERSTPWRFIGGRAPATGRLFGGCLEVLAWLRGTTVWPAAEALRGTILFLETSEEGPPPRFVARELRTLAAMGILQGLSGLLIGRPGGGVPVPQFDEYDRAVLEVVHDEAGLRELAVVTQMDFGHTDPMFVLPYGVLARIDPAAQTFEILESGVVD